MINENSSFNISNSSLFDESKNDKDLQEYVRNFQKQVEKKYIKSNMNKAYKIQKSENLKNSISNSNISDSLESLASVNIYNLNSQNLKKEIVENQDKNNENLIEILSKIGKWDKSYLKKQINKPNSKIFKILCKSITNEITNLKEKNSLKITNSSKKFIKIKKPNRKIFNNNLKTKKNLKINKNLMRSININNSNLIESKKLVVSSCKNNKKIKINSNLIKYLPSNLKILSNINIKQNLNIKKTKKIKKSKKKIIFTKGELKKFIYNMNNRKSKNNGFSIINNTKNVVKIIKS